MAPIMAPVRRHLPPATSHTCFSPERLLPSPAHARHMVFPDEAMDTRLRHCADIPGDDLGNLSLIPKPPGEAGRRSKEGRDGYNLRDALKWDEAFYQEVMVRMFIILGKPSNLYLAEAFQGHHQTISQCQETTHRSKSYQARHCLC